MKSKNFPYKNSKEFQTKLLNTAYVSLGIPLLLFLWVFLNFLSTKPAPMMSASFNYAAIVVLSIATAILVWMAIAVFRNGLKMAKGEEHLKDKLIIYEKVSKRKFLFLFCASLIASLGLYCCASEIFAALFFVIFFIFSIGSPTKDRIVDDLKLRDENKKVMLMGIDFQF